MAKKVKTDHITNAKSVVALFIAFLAFAVFLLFYTNKDTILESGNFKSLMIMIGLGMGLLVGLLYLVNPSKSSKKRKS